MSYKRLPGSARNYVDTDSGEVVSRAERDKRIGALFESGFSSYGARKESLDVVRQYDNKTGEHATVFKLKGVTDSEKAGNFFIKQNVASDTAFYSFRIKTSDGRWLSAKTGDMNSASGHIGALLAKYELDMTDIDDIEVVVLD